MTNETLYVSEGEKFWPNQIPTLTESKILKIGFIGPSRSGKSSLTVRYTQKVFIDEYMISFENFFSKDLIINDEHVSVNILDTPGTDEAFLFRPNWFKGNEAFIMVYAINDKDSL